MIADVENRLTPKKCSIKCLEIKGPSFAVPYHWHDEIEIAYIVSSHGRRVLGNHVSNFSPGDLVMIGSNLPHLHYNEPSESLSPTWAHAQVIQFKIDFMGKRFFKLSEMEEIEAMLVSAQNGLKFFGETKKEAATYIPQILNSRGPKRLHTLIEMLGEMANGGEYKSLCANVHLDTLDSTKEILLQNIVLRVTQDFSRDSEIEHLAKIYETTPIKIDALFAKGLNIRYDDFLNRLRVSHSCKLLRETKLTLQQISNQCGYLSSSQFIQHFKMLKKMTPTHFRKNVYIAGRKKQVIGKKRGWGKVRSLW